MSGKQKKKEDTSFDYKALYHALMANVEGVCRYQAFLKLPLGPVVSFLSVFKGLMQWFSNCLSLRHTNLVKDVWRYTQELKNTKMMKIVRFFHIFWDILRFGGTPKNTDVSWFFNKVI